MKRFLLGGLLSAFLLSSAHAQFSITITLDENGHGNFTNTNGFSSVLPFALQADPGPGGLAAALTYGLLNPPGLTAGDLILLEPGTNGLVSDIVRFNPSETIAGTIGALVFYSDKTDAGDTDLADTGFPTALYTNDVSQTEVGPEGNNGFSYTPTSGQPGFVTGAGGPVTYVIKSDVSAVPEPSSILLMVTVVGIVSYRFGWRQRHSG
jgi:hypothetical protein